MANDDPLALAGLEPSAIAASVEAKSKGKLKAPSELEIQKEERLKLKEQRLNVAKAAKHVKEVEKPPPPQVDATAILDKINAYKERFPELKSRNAKLSVKNSAEELLDELHYLELQLGSQKNGGVMCDIFVATLGALEQTSYKFNPMNLQLQGLGQIASNNKDMFAPVIDELMIKYSAGLYMSPEVRLVCMTCGLMLTVHKANTGDPRIVEAMRQANKGVNVPANSSDL